MGSVFLEFYKLRRKRIFLMIPLLLSVELAWACISVSMALAQHPGEVGWADTVMTVSSMNGLFLPILSAVIVSRICDMEHKGNTWKMLMSASVKRSRLYAAKYACAVLLLLFAVILQVVVITAFGAANAFPALPGGMLLKFIGSAMLTSLAVVALQQWVSLVVKNQAFALSLGMFGGFIGLTADLFPAAIRRFFIWSYYTGLGPVTYSYENEIMKFVDNPVHPILPLIALLAALLAYTLGSIHFGRQDV
ncbi:ABC transporter permease [Paenibacillus puldeungensis]|uniref:ABC transporter permease n=1 Tax=Paenibacillus puldeungensis TaxID=696536 RepID=A0ABW3S305_9BACL